MLHLTLFGGVSVRDASGTDIPLTSRKAKGLLAFLASPPGTARSREEIAALLWSDRAEAQARASLRQVLSALRRDLGEDALLMDQNTVALNPESVTLTPPDGTPFLAGLTIRDPAFDDWLRDERLKWEGAGDAAPTEDSAAVTEYPSVAVLPFVNLTPDADQDFIADGITQDIITELSRYFGLYVVAHRSSLQFRDKAMSAYEIGKALEVDYIVEGSVRRAGNRVRITAELIDVADDAHVWADRYDRDLKDVFAIQEDVAREIATIVPGQIDAEAYDRVQRRSGPGLTAYENVLKGEALREQGQNGAEAVPYFNKAIAADPLCARAYANLAHWHASQIFVPGSDFDTLHTKVRELGEEALRIEPNDPVILSIMAEAYVNIGDHVPARQCIEKAIRTNPNHYVVMGFAAGVLAFLGDVEEGLRWHRLYEKHDPLSYASFGEAAFEVLYLAGEFEAAIAALARFSQPPLSMKADLAAAHAMAGRAEEAAEWRAAFEDDAPAGYGIANHAEAITRACAHDRERDLWLEGYRRAGFVLPRV